MGRAKIEETPANCSLGERCGGCGWIKKPYGEQLRLKTERVRALVAGMGAACEVEIRSAGQTHLRDRADLVWQGSEGSAVLGMYGAEGLVDIDACEQMSEGLAGWYNEVRLHFRSAPSTLLTAGRQSVRLRVGVDGIRGTWLDFSNVVVRDLFEEKTWLRGLASKGIVEIGQRQKRLRDDGDRLRLVDPVLEPWFQTQTASGARIPLFGTIAGFSQAGFEANFLLCEAVRELAGQRESLLEFCCGNGNLSFALSENFGEIAAVEQNEIALNGFSLTLAELTKTDGSARAKFDVMRGNIYRMGLEEIRSEVQGRDVILFDPPRSGLGELAPRVIDAGGAGKIIYVSCYEESWSVDAALFLNAGYRLERVILIDQFAQSPHVEIVSSFVQSV